MTHKAGAMRAHAPPTVPFVQLHDARTSGGLLMLTLDHVGIASQAACARYAAELAASGAAQELLAAAAGSSLEDGDE